MIDDLTGSVNTWTPLPNIGSGSNAFALERGSDGGMYFATDVGVYYTNNKFMADGTGWQLLGGNLPHVNIRGLEINYLVNKLRVGTYGRGVWEHDLWCPDELNAIESGVHGNSDFVEVMENISSDAIVPLGLNVSYRGGAEVRLIPGFRAEAGSRFHAFIHPCNMPGNSFKALPVHEEAMPNDSDGGAAIRPTPMVYPNPSTGEFKVQLPTGVPVHRIRAYDTSGRQVPLQCQSQVQAPQCAFAGLTAPGTYLLVLECDDGSIQYTKIALLP